MSIILVFWINFDQIFLKFFVFKFCDLVKLLIEI